MITTYEEAREHIRDGDILICSGRGTFSRLIQKFTDSEWSHVAFVLWLRRLDRLMVLESMESKGVRCLPLSSYIRDMNGTGKGYGGRVCIFRDGRVAGADFGKLGKFAVDHFGYPCDNDEILRIMLRIASRQKRGKRKKDKEYICSEFAAACFAEIGIEFSFDPRGFITPGDFANGAAVEMVYELEIEG